MSSFFSWLSTTVVVIGLVFFCSRTAVAVCGRVVFEPVGSPTASALGVGKDGLVLQDMTKGKATVWELVRTSRDKKSLNFLIVDADQKMALSAEGGHLLFSPYDKTSKNKPNLKWLLRPASPALFIISMADSTHLSLAIRGQTMQLESYRPSQSRFFLMKMKDAKTGNLCRLTVFSPKARQAEPEQAQFLFRSLMPGIQIL